MKFLASFIPEISGGSQNSKSGSRDPHMTPFDLILHFSLVLTVVHLLAKFEVSSFIYPRDIRGVPKFQKVGHVTHFWNSGTPLISPVRLKLETSNLAQRWKAVSTDEKNAKLGQKGSRGVK